MTYDDEDENSDQEDAQSGEQKYAVGNSGQRNEETEDEDGDDFASDFDDFEEGAAADDFDDFDDGICGAAEAEMPVLSDQASQPPPCPFVSRAIVTSKVKLLDYRLKLLHGTSSKLTSASVSARSRLLPSEVSRRDNQGQFASPFHTFSACKPASRSASYNTPRIQFCIPE